MATMLPIPSSPFSNWAPFLLTATLCLSAAALRSAKKINTLAASLIAFGAIAQYFIHRENAKSALSSYATGSFDQYRAQTDDLIAKKNSLETAYQDEKQRSSHYKSLTQSMFESHQERQKRIDELNALIDQFEDQTVQRALTESTRIEDDLSKSWAMLGSQSEKEIESLKQEIKKLKSKIQLAQTKPQIKENRQLEGALKQELQLLKTKGMLEHIHQMRLLLHAFFPKVREAFGRAALHKIFCEKFNNSSMILDKEELQKLSQLSWEDYLGDGIENIVHIEAQLVEIFTKIQSVVSLKTNTMRQM